MKKRLLLTIISLITALSMQAQITVKDGHFLKEGKPYTYIGTNLWYGPLLGATDRVRLCRELDRLHSLGLDNLRILVGSDGEEVGCPYKVTPTLQRAPGVYNDSVLAGLDFCLMEMAKREMVAVLYLNNSWEWSGGYGYYLEEAGRGKCPMPIDGYETYCKHVSQFATSKKAQQLFFKYVKDIISRTNRYTGKKYTEDPAIMSWQIGNEPRAFSKEVLPQFEKWISKAAALIRRLDSNHLISVGSEGKYGCETSMESYERICSDRNIDYLNIHIWPSNWGWVDKKDLSGSLPEAIRLSREYIDEHVAVARKLGKPIVMEEFGYPRDENKTAVGSPTTARDEYYRFMLNQPELDGINFWAWGGSARPLHEWWQKGDPYCGDPAQEPQGLFSVFEGDSTTIDIIRNETAKRR